MNHLVRRIAVGMDQYRRVDVPKEADEIADNEIRVTQAGKVRKYIGYATQMLQVRPSGDARSSRSAARHCADVLVRSTPTP